MDGIRYGLEQGLCGWNVTDCKICFEYGLYYSTVSTPAEMCIRERRENFPSCFNADGSFELVRFSEFLKDKADISQE